MNKLEHLEKSFHINYNDHKDSLMLGLRLQAMGKSFNLPPLWGSPSDAVHDESQERTRSLLETDAIADANAFKTQYEREVQRVFSRVQHHWHQTDRDGRDAPMKHGRVRGKS